MLFYNITLVMKFLFLQKLLSKKCLLVFGVAFGLLVSTDHSNHTFELNSDEIICSVCSLVSEVPSEALIATDTSPSSKILSISNESKPLKALNSFRVRAPPKFK